LLVESGVLTRAFAAVLIAVATLSAAAAPQPRHAFGIVGNDFIYDGKPIQIMSGEMHYPRVPREYWRDRMKKARAMGLNTISTYVFWNLHEPRPGVWDFTGNLDVAAYIKMAGEEGLHVILRPGPYVCAEWDLGGYPSWLLADRSLVLRSTDPKFMAASAKYLARLGQELAPLQVGRGGPIIAIQVENEYGSFDKDHAYVSAVRDQFTAAGFTDALLYTADNPGDFDNGALPDLPVVANFGPGNAQKAFTALRQYRGSGPLMSGEYWAGWFDAWGTRHANTNGAQQADEIAWMLEQGHSFNLYMFHGGTSFGFMSGANADRNGYKPDVSSYDYDSALDEAGRPAPKFALFRDAILKHDPTLKLPPLPAPLPSLAVPAFTLTDTASLWDNLGTPVKSDRVKTMEEVGQSYGYILYRTTVASAASGPLVLTDLHDYAVLFVNGARVATLDRRLKENTATIDVPAGARLDILVENTARSNYGKGLRLERKGITDSVTLAGRELIGWEIYPLPMNNVNVEPNSSSAELKFGPTYVHGPAFHRGTFTVTAPGDTFLDMSAWTKGAVWVNGHHLGRFWNIGPQQTLFVPAPWLKRGKNEVIVFDLADAPASPTISGLRDPILNQTKK
jgi:beta-galactosidase